MSPHLPKLTTKRILLSLQSLVGLFLILSLSACGDPTSTTQVAASPTSAPATTAAATTSAATTAAATTVASATTAVANSQAAPQAAPMPGGRSILLNTTIDDLKLEVAVAPGIIGNNKFIARLSLADGSAVSDASLVKISCTHKAMPEMGTAVLALKLEGTNAPGLYEGEGYLMTMYGDWKMDVLVQRPGKADAMTTFDLSLTSSN